MSHTEMSRTIGRTQAEEEMSAMLHRAHQQAMQAKPDEMAAYFQRLLGQKWTAYMTGITDPKAVGKWARGERVPRTEAEGKLRGAYHVALLISMVDDEETARAWFVGMNPVLNDRAPAWVIAKEPDGSERAMEAARAFISYG
jgi:hypothetical protein